MQRETTDSLLARLRDFDDDAAWERLCERFRVPIRGFAHRLGVHEGDVEDVLQETLFAFATALREGRYDPGRGRLGSFLFGIAYRQTLAALRRRRAGADVSSSFFEQLPDDAEASASWDLEWERARLAQWEDVARAEFEPRTFRAYELVVRGGRSPAQAAAELGVPVTSVYNAKHRVLGRIRELRMAAEDGN